MVAPSPRWPLPLEQAHACKKKRTIFEHIALQTKSIFSWKNWGWNCDSIPYFMCEYLVFEEHGIPVLAQWNEAPLLNNMIIAGKTDMRRRELAFLNVCVYKLALPSVLRQQGLLWHTDTAYTSSLCNFWLLSPPQRRVFPPEFSASITAATTSFNNSWCCDAIRDEIKSLGKFAIRSSFKIARTPSLPLSILNIEFPHPYLLNNMYHTMCLSKEHLSIANIYEATTQCIRFTIDISAIGPFPLSVGASQTQIYRVLSQNGR